MPAHPAPPTAPDRIPGFPAAAHSVRPGAGSSGVRGAGARLAAWVRTHRTAAALCGLVALAFVPRALVAANLGGVCRDAHFYQSLAAHLRAGDFEHGFAYTGLNLFTALAAAIGAGAERVGWDPLRACVGWGVVAGGLTVVPLFDWLRRQFGARVAVGGCAAFAVHPTLIEVGVEPIREGTFWLAFLAALACLHRAAAPTTVGPAGDEPGAQGWDEGETPDRPPIPGPVWYLPAGLAAAAAVLTRSEGWLLVAPLVGWTALSLARHRAGRFASVRLRLAVGAGCAALLGPAVLAGVNVTALHAHDRWEWGRPALLADGAAWAGEAAGLNDDAPDPAAEPAAGPTGAPAAAPAAAPATPPARTLTTDAAKAAARGERRLARARLNAAERAANREKARAKRAARREAFAVRRRAGGKTLAGDPLWWGYLDGLAGAFKPALLLLIAVGSWVARRRLVRPDTWPLWAASASLLAAVWLRLEHHGDLNGRYFLLAGILALPSVGAALAAGWVLLAGLRVPAGLRARPRFAAPPRPRAAAAWVAAGLLAGLHLHDAVLQTHPRRDRERAAGLALRGELDRRAAATAGDAGGAGRTPEVWAYGPAANLAEAVGGRTRATYRSADPAAAAAAGADVVLLPRRGRRGAAYEPDADRWRAAGYRPLAPPAGTDAGLWEDYVALAPAAGGRRMSPVDSPVRETTPTFGVPPGDDVLRRTAAAPDAARGTY